VKGSSCRQDKCTQVKQLRLSTGRDVGSGCPKHISLVPSSVNLSRLVEIFLVLGLDGEISQPGKKNES
jgi:hypothetical protein